jgi:hypothetical protein
MGQLHSLLPKENAGFRIALTTEPSAFSADAQRPAKEKSNTVIGLAVQSIFAKCKYILWISRVTGILQEGASRPSPTEIRFEARQEWLASSARHAQVSLAITWNTTVSVDALRARTGAEDVVGIAARSEFIDRQQTFESPCLGLDPSWTTQNPVRLR